LGYAENNGFLYIGSESEAKGIKVDYASQASGLDING
jgi:hypothetical protein